MGGPCGQLRLAGFLYPGFSPRTVPPTLREKRLDGGIRLDTGDMLMSNHAFPAPTKYPPVFDTNFIRRIPSIELQTVAFVETVRTHPAYQNVCQEIQLSWNGFLVTLGFEPSPPAQVAGDLKNVFYIYDVDIPPRYRFRKWFTHYWRLCQQLAGGTLFILGSPPPQLRASLFRHGFQEVDELFWLITSSENPANSED